MFPDEVLPLFCPRVAAELRGKARAVACVEAVAELADGQHGVVARRQLLAAGVYGDWVDRRARSGRLVPVYRGVFAVGAPRLTRDGELMAAVLAAGPGAVVGLRSAGELLRVRDGGRTALDILVPVWRRGPRALGLRTTRDLRAEDVTRIRGIPCTRLARTLLDLAALVDETELRRIIADARRLGVLDEQALRTQRARHRGHPGAATLTRLVGLLDDRTESELEDVFLSLIRAAGLPEPEVNVRWDAAGRWVRTDFRWPGLLLVVEVDGWTTHRGRDAAEDDADRAASLRLAGWDLLRFTHRQVHAEPRRVIAAVEAVLARASARA